MNELRVNKEKISHIEIYDETSTGLKWVDKVYKHSKFNRFFGEEVVDYSGFYESGKFDRFSFDYLTETHYLSENKAQKKVQRGSHIIKDQELYINPRIKLYIGKHHLHTKFFDSLEGAKRYCKTCFPKINFVVN